jgi:outer membrane protease
MGAAFTLGRYTLKAAVQYSYMRFSWAAEGGSYLYPAGHFYEPESRAGTYKQAWHIVSPAVSFNGAFNSCFNITLSFAASPLIWCVTWDNHLMRNPPLAVINDMSGGFFMEPGLRFSFSPSRFFSLSVSVSYRHVSGVRGDSIYTANGQSTIHKNIGGAGYSALDAGAVMTLRFF